MAASDGLSLRGGSGRRALPPTMPGRSAANVTSSAGLRAMARRQPVTARLNGSVGLSRLELLPLKFEAMGEKSFPQIAARSIRSNRAPRPGVDVQRAECA